jgi:hypothetical protein
MSTLADQMRAENESRNLDRLNKFKELARPLVKFINDEFDPHTEIVIDCDSARILSGEYSVPIKDYIKD